MLVYTMNTEQTRLDGANVKISGRAAPIKNDLFAKHAEGEDRHFVVVEKNEFDEDPEIIAHREIEDYDANKIKEVGAELAEEVAGQ